MKPNRLNNPLFVQGGILFAIALLSMAYLQRGAIRDGLREVFTPALPEAVSYEQVRESHETPVAPANPPAIEPVPASEPEPTPVPNPVQKPVETPAPVAPTQEVTLPVTFNLAVPFTSQAPHAHWDHLHQEACEEASLIMAHAYYEGVTDKKIDPDVAEDAIQQLVAFAFDQFGYGDSTTVAETARFAEAYYGYGKSEIIEHPTIEMIKREVHEGHPVIVPMAGRLLGNPNFTGEGPEYHMLVVRGWTNDSFITNDPGTRNGLGYTYTYDVFMEAIHDWTSKGHVVEGKRVILVLHPKK